MGKTAQNGRLFFTFMENTFSGIVSRRAYKAGSVFTGGYPHIFSVKTDEIALAGKSEFSDYRFIATAFFQHFIYTFYLPLGNKAFYIQADYPRKILGKL